MCCASGFIGQLLATHLLTTHSTAPQNSLILTDLTTPPIPPKASFPQNTTCIPADLRNADALASLLAVAGKLDYIFLFHGIMSAGSESHFESGLNANLYATLALLEGIRNSASLQPERVC